MGEEAFFAAFGEIIRASAALLRPDRFACVVVGDVRDKAGMLVNFPGRTVELFRQAGLGFYNDACLVTAVGSLPVRARKQFETSRKLGRTHQAVLVFVKGDPRAATSAVGSVDFGDASQGQDGGEAAAEDDGGEEEEGETIAAPVPIRGGPRTIEDELTPVQAVGDRWLKRDDLYGFGGVRGGKVRTCLALARGAAGLVTAGSRASPQVNIVARVARGLGVPARCHVPAGMATPELLAAQAAGAEIVGHRPGHNSVIVARARADAAALGWAEIPFGMECEEAVGRTAAQVANLPAEARRVVVPVGSGMSLAGVLRGLDAIGRRLAVLGVVVGADPGRRLSRWAPAGWRAELRPSGSDYHAPATVCRIADVPLDPHYEAKCIPFLEPGDVLWCVGIRQTAG